MNRRRVVNAIGAGLAAAAVGPAFGSPDNPTRAFTFTKGLEDPKTKYPQPPFKGQKQPWPGLASQMDPVPDHGEKTYKGSGRLNGRKALITGGDSGMGRAAAIAYALEGADVAINYLPEEEADAQDPSADLYDYAQTKAATTNFVRSLAKQLGPKGIRVNGVAPGPIWTPLQVSGGATQEKLISFGGDTPLGRPGQPAELASIYVQLAADDASYATGQIYGAAGGGGQP